MNSRHHSLLYITVFITVISQTPFLREKLSLDTQLLILPFWALILTTIFLRGRIEINSGTTVAIFSACGLVICCLLLSVLTGESYFSSLTTMGLLSMVMLFVGSEYGDILVSDEFDKLCVSYIAACLIMAIDIYFEYLAEYSLEEISYVYRSKNSAGQIILTAIILLLYLLKNKKWIKLKILLIIFFLIEIILLRSRATLLSILFIPFVYLLDAEVKRKYKILILLALSSLIIFLTINENAYNLIISNIFLNSKSTTSLSSIDLNTVSSDRLNSIINAFEQINGKEFVGLGTTFYVDNFFVNAIGNYGIIFGFAVICLAISPLVKIINIKIINGVDVQINRACLIICLVYVFNGMFEGWAPFGPGAKCFIMWLVIGMLSSSKNDAMIED